MMSQPTTFPDFRQRVTNSFRRQPFMRYIGAELRNVEEGACEIYLPYRVELTQQHGYFHAGIIGTLADNAAGYAGFSMMAEDSSVLTAEFKINLLAPGRGEALVARAEVLKHGRSLTVCRTEVFAIENGEETRCAAAQVTLMELENTQDG